jgi:hypothetical protein
MDARSTYPYVPDKCWGDCCHLSMLRRSRYIHHRSRRQSTRMDQFLGRAWVVPGGYRMDRRWIFGGDVHIEIIDAGLWVGALHSRRPNGEEPLQH